MKILSCFILLLFTAEVVSAQVKDNRKCEWVRFGNIVLDPSVVVDFNSFTIKDVPDSTVTFELNSSSNLLTIRSYNRLPDSIFLCYRILDIPRGKYYSKSMELYDSMANFKDYGLDISPIALKKDQLFETGDVNTMGRLSRGFSIGSNQNCFQY